VRGMQSIQRYLHCHRVCKRSESPRVTGSFIFAFIWCWLLFPSPATADASADLGAAHLIAEEAFRGMLVRSRLPRLVESQLLPTPERVVVTIRLSSSSQIVDVKIQEAPTATIGRAFANAVADWTFAVSPPIPNADVMGNLTFYVLKSEGRAKILTPLESELWRKQNPASGQHSQSRSK
jgi:hypothetical protein